MIDVMMWSCQDVAKWLNSLSLPQFADSFVANEISGAILLDVSLDDLDYMGIKVLAHRKLILKGIEDLRKNKSIININPSETPQESPSTKSVDDSVRYIDVTLFLL